MSNTTILSSQESEMGFYLTKNNMRRFDFNKYAKYISQKYTLICVDTKTYYIYHNGVYFPLNYHRLTAMMYKTLMSVSNIWNTGLEENYTRALEHYCQYDGLLNPLKNLINLKNCMFDTHSFVASPHNPKYYSTIQLAVNYDENAICPEFMNFLKSVFADDDEIISVIQEIMGYCLTADTKAQCFFIFYGSGANGKSVLCNTIKKLVGKNNYSAVPISDLNHSFSRADLQNKMLNISTENESSNGKPYNSQYIKAISGGDEIKAEFKGKDVFSFAPFCKLIFAVNTLPNFNDKTYGFLRRIKIIPFTQNFSIDDGTADIHLEEKLEKELSGIFNWAVKGLKRLRDNNYKFSYSSAMQSELQKYNELINPYVAFWDECILYTPDNDNVKTSKKHLYEAFQHWCLKNNHINSSKVTARKFWIELNDVIIQKRLKPFKFKKTDGGTRFVMGIDFIDEEQRNPNIIRPKLPEKEYDLVDDNIDYVNNL